MKTPIKKLTMIQTLICPCCNGRFKIEALNPSSKNYNARPPKITQEQVNKLDEIATLCCHYFDITMSELKSASRKREVTLARHYFFFLCLRFTRISPAKIGFYCGGRDRTTIYHGETAVKNLVTTKDKDGKHLEVLLKHIAPLGNPLKVAS